jgi:hypothetical protein
MSSIILQWLQKTHTHIYINNDDFFLTPFLKGQFFVKENKKYFEIFDHILFFKMESSKLIN